MKLVIFFLVIVFFIVSLIDIKAQNVGISNASFTPQNLLHVYNSTTDGYIQLSNSTSGALSSRGILLKAIVSDFEILNQEATGKLFFNTTGGNIVLNNNAVAINTIIKSSGNANMLFVDGTNNRVGVGTASPNYALGVNGDAEILGDDLYGSTTGDNNFNLHSKGGIRMMIDNDNDGTEDFAVQNGGGSNIFVVTEAGNVDADGNGDFNGNLTLSGNTSRTFFGPTDAALDFKSETGYDIYLDSDNNGTSSVFAIKKDAGTSLFTIAEDNNAIFFPYGTATGETGGLKFRELAANGSNYFGFRAPDALGSDYMLTLPSGYGSNGQALLTNGSGGLSWGSTSDTDDWKLTGNSGTTAGTNFLGTTDAQDMVFKAGGSGVTGERIRLKNASYEIVFGAGDGAATTYSPTLRGPDRTGTDKAGADISFLSGNGTGTGGSGDIIFQTAPVAATSSTANTMTERMRIMKDGKIGIGQSVPNQMLHIKNTSTVTDGSDGALINLENFVTTTNATSGLRFKVHTVSSTGNFKGAIFYRRTGGFGVGDIAFCTNNTGDNSNVSLTQEKMLVKSSGDIVIGNGDNSPTTASGILRGPDRTGTNVAGVDFAVQAGNGTGTGGSGDIVFNTAPTAASSSTANTQTEVMRITKTARVGIGTNSPGQTLHVNGDAIIGSSTAYDGNSEYMEIKSQSDSWYVGVQNEGTVGESDFFIGQNADETGQQLHIENGGNVGIGTSSPDAKLHVSGKIHSSDYIYGAGLITNYSLYKTDADWAAGYSFTIADNKKLIPFSDVIVDGDWHASLGACQFNFVVKVTNRTGNCYVYLFKDGIEVWALQMTSDVMETGWQNITWTNLATFDIRVGDAVNNGGKLEQAQLLIRPQY